MYARDRDVMGLEMRGKVWRQGNQFAEATAAVFVVQCGGRE